MKYRRRTVSKYKYHASMLTNAMLLFSLFCVGTNTYVSNYKVQKLTQQVYAMKAKEISIAEQTSEFGRLLKTAKPKIEYVTPTTIEDKIRATFPENPDLAVAIAKCESGLNPKAFNGKNTNGSWDAGLMQVNSVHGVSKAMLMNEDVNLAVSRVIFERAGNSFSPWVCARKVSQ